jgi:hypothetical protein
MNPGKYNLPKTRQAKINFIKGLMKGESGLESLLSNAFEIKMWKEDETNTDVMTTFDGLQRMSRKDFEHRKATEKGSIFITLEL